MKKLLNKLRAVINELAYDRKTAIYDISHLCPIYTEHIMKLAVFGNMLKHEYDTPKWKDEIFNFIDQACLRYDLKGSKHLKPRDYMDNFFFALMETDVEVERNFNRMLKNYSRKGYEVPNNINYARIYKSHCKFVELVLNKFPEADYDFIIEMLDKYIVGVGCNI